ncbi:ribonuclease H family protein [Marimonas arenosa]|uniref:Ribonuclease H n=1 Tax=Marimonas arenosa TaxID=1795305 RepID=A0AAE3WDN6_9RHOB|nr:ribonuclease H [Marimonas arenosa]MDQ2091061.1 ribonuclease HI [Marimonas arenosa]
MTNTKITIHTDGSCIGNPGKGAWVAVIRRYQDGVEVKKSTVSGGARQTTNNQMEMRAALAGLQKIKRDERATIRVYSDSQLLVKGMNDWVPGWQRKNWRKADGSLVKNRELWEALIAVCDGLSVQWEWVRGHDGDLRNEEVDGLAFVKASQL